MENQITTETVEVKAKKVKKEAQTCPLTHSNFFLTINSQKDISSMDIDEQKVFVDRFQAVIRQFFNGDFQRYLRLEGSKKWEMNKDVCIHTR